MANMHEMISQGSLNETVFTAVYEWSASKTLNILLSICSILFITPWLYYMIWYERYGANHRRTLINQFAASHSYYAVFYILVGQSLEVMLTTFGPFGDYACHFQEFLQGVMTFQFLHIFTFIFTVKYFYIFVLRNPSGIDEEFWCFFLNMWSLLISCLTQFVYQFMPGRHPIKFYICCGKFDNLLSSENAKINYAQICYLSLAVIWYMFAAIRISQFKKYINGITAVPVEVQDTKTTLALLLKDTFNVSLVNIAMVAVLLSIVALNIALKAYLNTLEPASFNNSPNHQLHLFTDHSVLVISYICVVLIYYSRNSLMRQTIFREMKDTWLEVKECCCFN
jgi:hypothetical protein